MQSVGITCRRPSLTSLSSPSSSSSFLQLHSDGDRGDGSARYVLTGEGAGSLFRIDEKSGDIHATKRLDREEKAYYILRAKAVDRFTNEALEGESEFVIKIHDINDNEPRFTKDLYMARVPEMSDMGTWVWWRTTCAVNPSFHTVFSEFAKP